MSDKQESLKFKIGISGTGSPNSCQYRILLNDIVMIESESKAETVYHEFESTLTENQNSLIVELLDKSSKHVLKDDNENIIEDFLLNIHYIEIDEIDLGSLIWTHSKYYPKYPENYTNLEQKTQEVVTNCVNLGWNGKWVLEFDSPFYIWLLENI